MTKESGSVLTAYLGMGHVRYACDTETTDLLRVSVTKSALCLHGRDLPGHDNNTNYKKDHSLLFAAGFGMDAEPMYTKQELFQMISDMGNGKSVRYRETLLDPDMDFYVLGLSPNAARISVRFFLHNSFGSFMENVRAHQERLEIAKPAHDKQKRLSIWAILDETANQNARGREAKATLAAETLCAVLNNTNYPATLLKGVELRVRAEKKVTRGRAAIIKAYYLKNRHADVPEGVLTVPLNPDCGSPAYVLGRLFSVLEATQTTTDPGLHATIKDKYFNAAAAAPAKIFPLLINLTQKHLRKLRPAQRTYYDKQIAELLGKLENSFPAKMNLAVRGAFQLGYYHQTQKRFAEKEKQNNV